VHASLLRDYLAGRVGSRRLRCELEELVGLADAWGERGAAVDPLDEPFELYPRHLLALCEAVATRELEPVLLAHASRVLAASGSFRWSRTHPDGRVVEEVLVEWSSRSPAALEAEAMPLFRDWLVTRRRPERFGLVP
jgi:hypothetical protein